MEEIYEKLNYYLNEICIYLEKEHSLLLDNLYDICRLNDNAFLSLLEKFDLNNKTSQNNLTYQEVFDLAREIIEHIDKNYLESFDNLIESGELDFSYDNSYFGSHLSYTFENGKRVRQLININRDFTYNDVDALVHEFIHYTSVKRISKNIDYFDEFLSIYFEFYAIDYLLKKGINKNEIDYLFRIKSVKRSTIRFSRYNAILLAYTKFGKLDKNTFTLLQQYFLYNDEKDNFEKMCIWLYDKLCIIEEKNKEKIEKNPNELGKILAKKFIASDYQFILGTILALYAYKYCDFKDIVDLNNHISELNDFNKLDYMSFFDICLSIGIDLHSKDFYQKLCDATEEYIQDKKVNYKENLELINAFMKYMKEKYGIDYVNDPKYIGMMYYGSRLTGNYNETSDLDLCIICDSSCTEEYKGVVRINGIDIEYVEKSIDTIYSSIDREYQGRNSFPKSTYSRACIIFEKDDCITKLKEYVNSLFAKGFELPLEGEIFDDLAIMDNRFSELKLSIKSGDNSFDILYFTLLDKIKTTYHKINGISRIEIYKAIRAYRDLNYRETALGIDDDIDENYISLFLQCLNSNGLSKEEKLERLDNLIKYIKSQYALNYENFEFEIYKRPPFYQSKPIVLNDMESSAKVDLDERTKDCVTKFITYKNLQERQDYIGLFIYKNNLCNENEIEVIVLLDSSDEKMFKGKCTINGITVKYVMVHDDYLLNTSGEDNNRPCPYKSNQQGFLIPNNIAYSIVADEKNIALLEDFVSRLFSQNFKEVEFSKYSGEMIVIDNRKKRLKSFVNVDDCNYFDMYYYIIMGKMINAYRSRIGSCYINPDNAENRLFLEYFDSAIECRGGRQERFDVLNRLYEFLKGSIEISVKERVNITPKYGNAKKRLLKLGH